MFFSIIWHPGLFQTLDQDVSKLPERIQAPNHYLDFDSFCAFNGFAEVFDQWYLVSQAVSVRSVATPARFVRAPLFGKGAFLVYLNLSTEFKTEFKPAFTQLMQAGQAIEITFWGRQHVFKPNAYQDTKTLLTWRGRIRSIERNQDSGATPSTRLFNFCILVHRPTPGDDRWLNVPWVRGVDELCSICVFDTATLEDEDEGEMVEIFMKLSASTSVSKKRLASAIRLYDKEPLEFKLKGDRLAVGKDDLANWSDDCSSRDADNPDNMNLHPDTFNYPFEIQHIDLQRFKLVGKEPDSKEMTNPDSTVDFLSGLDDGELERFLGMMLPDVKYRLWHSTKSSSPLPSRQTCTASTSVPHRPLWSFCKSGAWADPL